MIQRIQSLFWLIAAVLTGITLFAPVAWFGTEGEMTTLYAFAMEGADGTSEQMPVWTGILLTICTLLPAVTIFLFKNRMLQVRLSIVEVVLLIGSLIMLGYTYIRLAGASADAGLKPAIALPLVALVFVLLAARATFKDEVLVRSLDRIR